MNQNSNSKPYELDQRTFAFAKDVRLFVRDLNRTISNSEDTRQLIRSSGSVGANYIEANESLSKKDFLFRVKICRKEAKESAYWLRLVGEINGGNVQNITKKLEQEANELKMIFSAIINNSK